MADPANLVQRGRGRPGGEIFMFEQQRTFGESHLFARGNDVAAAAFEAHSNAMDYPWPLGEAEEFSEESPE
jgi:hypothetical protein